MRTTRTRTATRRLALTSTALIAGVALLAAGCGGNSKKSNSGSGGGGSKTIVIGTSADFPPMMIRDQTNPQQVTGFEADMTKAVMANLGRKYQFKILSFEGIIPAVQSHRIDLAISDIFHTSARSQVVDFVDYMQSALAVMTLTKNGSAVHGYLDLCGKAMGVVTGSPSETTAAQAGSQQCTSAGKPAIKIQSFPAVSDELTQLNNGRLYALLEDELSLAYIQKQKPGQYAVPFTDPSTAIKIGLVTAKGSSLRSKLQTAVQKYISSSQYATDAQKWGIPSSSLLH